MNETSLYNQLNDASTFTALKELGTAFSKSNILGITSPADGLIVAMTCAMEHISPIAFSRRYNIIGGRLSVKADAIYADFIASGGRCRWIRSDAEVAEAEFSHVKLCPDPLVRSVTMQELINNGVAVDANGRMRSPYVKFPKNMLRARLLSNSIRMIAPGLIHGLYVEEEVVSDIAPPTRTLDLSKPIAQKEVPVQALPKPEPEPEPEPEPASEPKDITELLIEKEAIVNNFLCDKLHWITGEQTWRNLAPRHMDSIKQRTAQFLERAEAYFKEQYDE